MTKVTRQSAIAAIEHVDRSNTSGRFEEAVQMLVEAEADTHIPVVGSPNLVSIHTRLQRAATTGTALTLSPVAVQALVHAMRTGKPLPQDEMVALQSAHVSSS